MTVRVVVYGASGHTGGFILAELRRRGHDAVAGGRAHARLDAPADLDRLLHGADALVNAAGPFLDTAAPLVRAALRAGVPYLDVTAEQASAQATFAEFDDEARARGVAVVPAVAFFGGFGDLLVTDAMGEAREADRATIAIALDRWWPTAGTRRTGERNTVPRVVLVDGALRPLQPSAPRSWTFPAPFETHAASVVPFTETILIARHLRIRDLVPLLSERALDDIRDDSTPPPAASDERGRSVQRFAVDVRVLRGTTERRVVARGQDIYAVTAPIVAEVLERVRSRETGGVLAVGEAVDATSVLDALVAGGEITLERDAVPGDDHV